MKDNTNQRSKGFSGTKPSTVRKDDMGEDHVGDIDDKDEFQEAKRKLKAEFPAFSKDIEEIFSYSLKQNPILLAKTLSRILTGNYVMNTRAVAKKKEKSDAFAISLYDDFKRAKENSETVDDMAFYLNTTAGRRTSRGKLFNRTTVTRITIQLRDLGMDI